METPVLEFGLDSPANAIAMRPDVTCEFDETSAQLITRYGGFALRNVAPSVMSALRSLEESPITFTELFAPLGERAREQMNRVLFEAARLFDRCVISGHRELLRVESTTAHARYEPAPVDLDTPLRLSKFAFCRTYEEKYVVECPTTMHRALLCSPETWTMVGRLARSTTARQLGDGSDELSTPELAGLLANLVGAGFVERGRIDRGAAVFPSDRDPVLRQWDFHDLLFHTRSRRGRYDDPYGGVFQYLGDIPSQPALKEVPTGAAWTLPRPTEPDGSTEGRAGLLAALDRRRSVRRYSSDPVTVAELGRLLFNCARVVSTREADSDVLYDLAYRPYPGGGAAYELELYLTVRRCVGLPPGIYYYDPASHRAVLINDDKSDREDMLRSADLAKTGPDLLVTITSRFQRLSWKYRSMAYATTLRDTGVLYQTMYLVATAMNLGVCAVGGGNSEEGARILGLDYLQESPVGELLLGRLHR